MRNYGLAKRLPPVCNPEPRLNQKGECFLSKTETLIAQIPSARWDNEEKALLLQWVSYYNDYHVITLTGYHGCLTGYRIAIKPGNTAGLINIQWRMT